MQDKSKFNPESIELKEFKMLKGQVEAPENFDINLNEEFHLENTFQLAFNLTDKLAKADLLVNVKSIGKNEQQANGSFHLVFIFLVKNLDELAANDKNNFLQIDPVLANALASISYSTSRGILLTRLQGTALQNFVLPIINPGNLIHNK